MVVANKDIVQVQKYSVSDSYFRDVRMNTLLRYLKPEAEILGTLTYNEHH